MAALLASRPLRRRERLLVGPECDRSAVWRGEPPPCSVFRAPASEFIDLAPGNAWTGPLFILADGGTASAAEDFIVWLHGSGAATLIGQRTLGAGCGYVDGGAATRLQSAPIGVRMPNCARYLSDGTNEIEGIAPDIELPLNADDFASALQRALGTKQQ
jgi:C-terminal processing protease CtpA/Prc